MLLLFLPSFITNLICWTEIEIVKCLHPAQILIDFDSHLKVGCNINFDSQPFKPIAIVELLVLYKLFCKSNMGTDNLTRKRIAHINCL